MLSCCQLFPAPVEQVSPPGSKLFVDSESLLPDERTAFSLHQPPGSWCEDLVGLGNVMQREADEQGPVYFTDDRDSLTVTTVQLASSMCLNIIRKT